MFHRMCVYVAFLYGITRLYTYSNIKHTFEGSPKSVMEERKTH